MSKKIYSRLAIAVFAIVIACCIWDGLKSYDHCDFITRRSEIECVRSGVDPYDIFKRKITSERYSPSVHEAKERNNNEVNAYPPYEYTFMYWSALVSQETGLVIFHFLNIVAFAVIALLAYHYSRRQQLDKTLSVLVALLALGNFGSVALVLGYANFSIITAAAAMGMCWALYKKQDVWAGVLWALVMLKIQVGALFFFPLLFSGKYKTISVAAAICLLASCFPAYLVDKPVWVLIWHLHDLGADWLDVYNSGLFFPLARIVPSQVVLILNFVVVVPFCAWASWKLRHDADWLKKMFPAAICCLLWTYTFGHDRMILALPLTYFAVQMLLQKDMRFKLFYGIVVLSLMYSGEYIWDILFRRQGIQPPSGSGLLLRGATMAHHLFWLLLIFVVAVGPEALRKWKNYFFGEKNETEKSRDSRNSIL